jgi:hypothetical protein
MLATLQLVQQAGISDRPKVVIPETMKICKSGADKKLQIRMIHTSEQGNQTKFCPKAHRRQQQPGTTRRTQRRKMTKTKQRQKKILNIAKQTNRAPAALRAMLLVGVPNTEHRRLPLLTMPAAVARMMLIVPRQRELLLQMQISRLFLL